MLSDNGKILARLISDYSQEVWRAGWMHNVEHSVYQKGKQNKNEFARLIYNFGWENKIWVRWNSELTEHYEGLYIDELPMFYWEEIHNHYMQAFQSPPNDSATYPKRIGNAHKELE